MAWVPGIVLDNFTPRNVIAVLSFLVTCIGLFYGVKAWVSAVHDDHLILKQISTQVGDLSGKVNDLNGKVDKIAEAQGKTDAWRDHLADVAEQDFFKAQKGKKK
jgi:uncharacterized protein YoxC